MFALEIKKGKMEERENCPFCTAGRLTCATCQGEGTMLVDGAEDTVVSCPVCEGSGNVVCVICGGDGRAVPAMLQTKPSRDPESDLEDVGVL